MAAFAYSAINALGAESAGQITAPDVNSARELLRQKGLRPVSLAQLDAVGAAQKKNKRVKARSLQVFSRQFATMIDAGLSVVSVARHPRAADRRQGAGRRDQRGALRRRGRHAPLAGDGAPPERVRPPLHLDDRGRRGSGHPRHRPRPGRDPDREGDEDPAPREGRDDLPARRPDLRPPDPGRDAPLPRPGLREDLLRPRTATCRR